MSFVVTSAPWQQVPMPAIDLRTLVASLVSSEGVRSAADLAVAQRAAGANMSVDIASGFALVQADHAANRGYYVVYNDATYNLTGFTAADATNPRVDRVAVRIRDAAFGDAANDEAPIILTGTPTGGATLANCTGAAAVPNNYLLLANVLIPAASASITTANIDTTGASNNSPKVRPVMVVAGSSPGSELDFASFTANVSVTHTTEATADLVVSGASVSYDGNPVVVEFIAPTFTVSANTVEVTLVLLDGATVVGQIAKFFPGSASGEAALIAKHRFTPSAGAHQYKIAAFTNTGTASIKAGAGGAGTLTPGFMRVTKV